MSSKLLSKKVAGYRLSKILGKGSYGMVRLAKHESKDGFFAVKVMCRKYYNNKRRAQMLEREISIMKDMNHENVLRLLGDFTSVNNIYLVVEFCKGGDLKQFIRYHNRLNEFVIWKFVIQMVRGLHYLHSKGVMHRDIKPQNLLLTEFSPDAIIKFADFGMSKEATMAQTPCGTPLYTAPEIFKMEKYNAKADMWSFGCVWYEMCTGAPPFFGSDNREIFSNILSKSLHHPLDKTVSKGMVSILKHLLETDPDQRASLNKLLGITELVAKLHTQEGIESLTNNSVKSFDILSGVYNMTSVSGADQKGLDNSNTKCDVDTQAVSSNDKTLPVDLPYTSPSENLGRDKNFADNISGEEDGATAKISQTPAVNDHGSPPAEQKVVSRVDITVGPIAIKKVNSEFAACKDNYEKEKTESEDFVIIDEEDAKNSLNGGHTMVISTWNKITESGRHVMEDSSDKSIENKKHSISNHSDVKGRSCGDDSDNSECNRAGVDMIVKNEVTEEMKKSSTQGDDSGLENPLSETKTPKDALFKVENIQSPNYRKNNREDFLLSSCTVKCHNMSTAVLAITKYADSIVSKALAKHCNTLATMQSLDIRNALVNVDNNNGTTMEEVVSETKNEPLSTVNCSSSGMFCPTSNDVLKADLQILSEALSVPFSLYLYSMNCMKDVIEVVLSLKKSPAKQVELFHSIMSRGRSLLDDSTTPSAKSLSQSESSAQFLSSDFKQQINQLLQGLEDRFDQLMSRAENCQKYICGNASYPAPEPFIYQAALKCGQQGSIEVVFGNLSLACDRFLEANLLMECVLGDVKDVSKEKILKKSADEFLEQYESSLQALEKTLDC